MKQPAAVPNQVRNPLLTASVTMGAGMALGFLLIFVLFISPLPGWLVGLIAPLQLGLKALFGVILIFVMVGVGGAVAGALGGLAISRISEATTRRNFIVRGALAFAAAHALLFIPTVALIALTSFFNQDLDVSFSKLPRLMGVLGLLYGIVGGLIFGLLTAGLRRVLGVLLASAAGFALGGLLLGLFLRFAGGVEGPLLRLLLVTAGFFLFGAAGGALLGFDYRRLQTQQVFLPDSPFWRAVRAAAVIFVAFMALLGLTNLINFLTINWPPLAEQLSLPTVGTAWNVAQGVPQTPGLVAGTAPQVICDNGRVSLLLEGHFVTPQSWPGCFADPLIAQAADGRGHIVYYSEAVRRGQSAVSSGHFLLESIFEDDSWSEPAIIAQAADRVEPQLSSGADKELILTWEDSAGAHYATMTPYSCDQPPPGRISQAVLEAVEQGAFWDEAGAVTYCDNRFDRLHFTPNPSTALLPEEESPNGAFDSIADVVRGAQYEVLFVTMQWDKPSRSVSPGLTLTEAIADLYRQVKANPQRYPRGVTVRILLGNLPQLTVFGVVDQMFYVLQDLSRSGVDIFQDEEIGWNLEIGNFQGAWPHAHSKFIVVDGKTAAAAGFNYSYLHLPKNHPSGQGLGMTDLAVQMTGPIAQSVMAAYDDLWANSDLLDCLANIADYPLLQSAICRTLQTEVTHVPEVLRFHPQEDTEGSAFALHHTPKHLEADAALLTAIKTAESSIDLFEVNFSLDTVCVALAILSDLCAGDEFAPPYMHALLEAMVERDVVVRAIVETSAMNGFENRMGIRWLQNHLQGTGKEDNLQVKFSANKMHDKAVLIDEEWLSIGSQNFHWSAWDSPSLTEYNIATDNTDAVSEFLAEYDHWWELGVPAREQMSREDIFAALKG